MFFYTNSIRLYILDFYVNWLYYIFYIHVSYYLICFNFLGYFNHKRKRWIVLKLHTYKLTKKDIETYQYFLNKYYFYHTFGCKYESIYRLLRNKNIFEIFPSTTLSWTSSFPDGCRKTKWIIEGLKRLLIYYSIHTYGNLYNTIQNNFPYVQFVRKNCRGTVLYSTGTVFILLWTSNPGSIIFT